jgi:RNA polymerase sigma factor (sigma-70 family)
MDKEKKGYIENMWQEYEPYIRKLCKFKLSSLPDYIDDCIQDVFLDFSEALYKGKKIDYPKAWLTKVANNKIKDIYTLSKKENEKLVVFEAHNLDTTSDGVVYDEPFSIGDEQITFLREIVIHMLDEKDQQLLQDRYTKGKSIAQIAEENNTTENNIYQKLFRLREKTKIIAKKLLNEL